MPDLSDNRYEALLEFAPLSQTNALALFPFERDLTPPDILQLLFLDHYTHTYSALWCHSPYFLDLSSHLPLLPFVFPLASSVPFSVLPLPLSHPLVSLCRSLTSMYLSLPLSPSGPLSLSHSLVFPSHSLVSHSPSLLTQCLTLYLPWLASLLSYVTASAAADEAEAQNWRALLAAMVVVGFSEGDIEHVISMLVVLCQLGALRFEAVPDSEGARLADPAVFDDVVDILGADAHALLRALCTTVVVVRTEVYVRDNDPDKVSLSGASGKAESQSLNRCDGVYGCVYEGVCV